MTIATLSGVQAPAVKALLECADLAALKTYLGVVGGGGGSDPWTTIRLTSDYSTSAIAASDVTGLGFAPAASTRYEVEGRFLLQTAVGTAGPQHGLAWPNGVSDGVAELWAASNVTAGQIVKTGNASAALLCANTGVATANVSWPARLWALFEAGASPSGSFQVQLASEIAATQVVMKAGSFLRYRIIS